MRKSPTTDPLDNSPNSKACLYMYRDAVVLAKSGPPFVMTSIKSKKLTDHIVINMRLMRINGLSRGSVM